MENPSIEKRRLAALDRLGILDTPQTPRSVAFCDHSIQQDKILLVEDATRDPRFQKNPLVTGKHHKRFYAGIPVREPSGFKIGSFCIIDDNKHVPVSHLSRSIHRAQNVFLTSDIERAAFELMLSDLLSLTGSEFGFIGEVLQ